MGGHGVDARMTRTHDSGVAFRISFEMPLHADLPTLAAPLEQLTAATLEHADPDRLERLADEAVEEAWDEYLHDWTCETLVQMRGEYESRLEYLRRALDDVTEHGRNSLLAPHVARRLGERLALEVQLQGDYFDSLECDLDQGAISRQAAVAEIAVLIGKRLDIPSHEVSNAQRRVFPPRVSSRKDTGGSLRRAITDLATDERRDEVRRLALDLADDAVEDAPHVAAALREAVEASSERDPPDDPLWAGAVRGVLLQHDAWRLDGPHLDGFHAVFAPL